MGVEELLSNINVTESILHDRRSIKLLKEILPDDRIDCSQLQEGGTMPNIDGYIEILDKDGRAREKITVQVKHLTYSEKEGKVFYDIPMSIYAYAKDHKGELIFFIACDYVSRIFYWRNIDIAAIDEFKNKSGHIQTKARYYFQENEKCCDKNVETTIGLWRRLYKQKMESIKDEKYLADQFASRQRIYFNAVSSELHGVKDSHILRHEVVDIEQWISKDFSEIDKNICLLVGDAGVGKSAVLKDVISRLSGSGVKYLCVKADAIDDKGNPISAGNVRDTLAYYSAEVDKVILFVDQIDALSQSLSNDRMHLNMMIAILSSLNDWPNVRAVVSCRKYDLEYDSVLNSLKDKSMIIEIGELTEEEVTSSLNRLEDGLAKKVDRVTFKMLRTVQMLDSFSILFRRDKSRIRFNSQIELYDAIWETIVCCSSFLSDIKIREQLMFKIAETVRETGTLNPLFTPTSTQKHAYEYLASNGLIRRDGRSVSFFHQSFYEYTLARNYSDKCGLFSIDLKKEIQGLEVRSTVKAILDFKRGHDIAKFLEEARSILFDHDIRLHLKLLTLSVLAFLDNPSRGEKDLVIEICLKDERMLAYFLRGVNSPGWLPTIRKVLNNKMSELLKGNGLFFTIISCLSRYVFDNPQEVYGLINMIKDEESKLYAVAYVLREHNDYSCSCVLKAYAETRIENSFFIVNELVDAIDSNIEFVLNETEKLILEYLTTDHVHEEYVLVDVLCPKLRTNYPMQLLKILHYCICETVRKKAQVSYSCVPMTMTFSCVDKNGFVGKLLEIYKDLAIQYSSDTMSIRIIVPELLVLNDETTVSLAFQVIAKVPEMFDGLIRSILSDNKRISGYLSGNVGFFFLKMLSSWYTKLDKNDAIWYQKLLLSYKSEYDFQFYSERKYNFLCPYLWKEKWKLICNTLPDDSMIPEMKKCAQELMRRFGRKSIVEKQDYNVFVTTGCNGIVSNAVYEKWHMSDWLTSFIKLTQDKWLKDGHHVSLRDHADAFKKCVTSRPGIFFDLVKNIGFRPDILDIYKIAGLEGLLAGGIDPYSIWPQAKLYITEDYAKNNSYTFSKITEFYLKEDNIYIDEILKICENLVIIPFSGDMTTKTPEAVNADLSNRATDLFTKGINSFQGRAAQLLVHICMLPLRRQKVYSYFTDNSTIIPDCVKAIPLHYLYVEGYYDEELYFPMLKSLLSGMGSEALYIQSRAIQWCCYYRNNIVDSYIDRIKYDCTSHELLSQIYFYGIAGTQNPDKCEKRLERIIAYNNEKVIAKIVAIAMESYVYDEYRELSIRYLERFSTDGRKDVIDSYCIYCDALPVDAFPWYYEIAKIWSENNCRDIYRQLKYVKKCVSAYPVLCYKFILSQKYWKIENAWMTDSHVVAVLLEIYKKLKFDEDTDAINEVLDLFDEYIYRGNRVMKDMVSLLE